jgi:signal transduction histidine kinase
VSTPPAARPAGPVTARPDALSAAPPSPAGALPRVAPDPADAALTARVPRAPALASALGSGVRPGPVAGRRLGDVALSRYPAFVLRAVSWLVRAGAFVLVGVETFAGAPDRDGAAAFTAFTAVAYAASGVLMAAWWYVSTRLDPDGERTVLAPVLLGAVTVLSGAACVFPHNGALVAFALLATLDAGSGRSLPAGWAVAGAGALAVETGVLVAGAGEGVALGYPLLLLVVLLTGHNRRAYRLRAEQSAAMLAQVERLRAEQRRVAVLDERNRIAREIHDVLAHSLGALSIQIQAARALLTDDRDVDRAVEVLTGAHRLAADGLQETRHAVHALRRDTAPLDEELAGLTRTHRRQHDVPAGLTVDGRPAPLPADRTLCLVRTAQESLTNAAKHAPARPVEVVLRYEERQVTLTVSNPLGDRADGGPAFATVDGGYGLTGMRERLLLAGGTLTAGTEGDRWVVTARVPR